MKKLHSATIFSLGDNNIKHHHSIKDSSRRNIEFEVHRNYNGSGDLACGCQSDWPVLTLRVGFLQGEDDLRDKLHKDLTELMDDWLDENLPAPLEFENGLQEDDIRVLFAIMDRDGIAESDFGFSYASASCVHLSTNELVEQDGRYHKITHKGREFLKRLKETEPRFYSHLETLRKKKT
jgi:hypothetical protein